MLAESPFHEGERAIQKQLGVEAIDSWARQVIRPTLPDQHRAFHTALPFLVAAARDEEGRPWATLLAGEEGFVTSPNDMTLEIEARPAKGDALEDALTPETDLGLLGIELHSRRRNRVNGRLAGDANRTSSSDALVFRVDQSFGNCPQYIHERAWERVVPRQEPRASRHSSLTRTQRAWIARADTLFVASGHRGEGHDAAYGMDASHRGGDPGFVHVDSDQWLTLPDYAGNNHFNTLGNLLLDPRIGLLFVDFDSGSLLQLTGRAEIIWDGPALANFEGARRLVSVEIEQIVEIRAAVPLRWRSQASAERTLELVDRVEESAEIVSFLLRDASGQPLPRFKAGQFLPIELDLPADEDDGGEGSTAKRTYSLSNGPNQDVYRISVKRDAKGLVSRALHDHLEVGDLLRVGKPGGDFVLPGEILSADHDDAAPPPIVLISAGVGATPLLSMLHELARRSEAGERVGPVHWIHGARDGDSHAFRDEVEALAVWLPQLESHVYYSRPSRGDRLGRDYDAVGRIGREALAPLAMLVDAQYFLCGPSGFMSEVQLALIDAGIATDMIHSERFGPASLA